jgi:hypothetical protein
MSLWDLEPITSAPKAFLHFAERINQAGKCLALVKGMRGVNGVAVRVTDGNIVIAGTGAGNGVPDGYVEREVILCENGEPITGTILFRPDE